MRRVNGKAETGFNEGHKIMRERDLRVTREAPFGPQLYRFDAAMYRHDLEPHSVRARRIRSGPTR